MRASSRIVHLLLLGAIAGGAACADRAPDGEPSVSSPGVDRCLRSPHSVLLGPSTGGENQRAGPGWMRLATWGAGDSGAAELVDGDRSGLQGTWRRTGDSVRVVAFDDFLRVELAIQLTDAGASGRGSAHSDAALERDAAGQLVDLRRQWAVDASTASCDSMPRRNVPGSR